MLEQLKGLIRTVPDFPKAGIQFLDISPVLSSPGQFQVLLSQLGDLVDWNEIDIVLGVESRGFIIGAALAAKHNKGFVPCRKAGKLPPPVIAESYELEYGRATLEIQPGHGRALIIDDVLATGGTLTATMKIAQQAGYTIADVIVMIEIRALNDLRFKGERIKSLLKY